MAGGPRHSSDEILAAALATGATIEAAARQANVSERTAKRRLTEASFRQRVSDLRAAMLERTTGVLVSFTTFAAARLRQLAESTNERVALGACVALLDQAVRLREGSELEERLRRLEEAHA